MLTPRWRKVLADLWDNKVRTLLVVASITVGSLAVGTIAGAYVMIPTDMTASYLASNPANIRIWCDDLGKDMMRAVAGMDDVAQAEGRRIVSTRLLTRNGAWVSLDLWAMPPLDEVMIHTPRLLQGVPRAEVGEVILANKTAERHGLALGDAIVIELADGVQRKLRVVGIAQDLSGNPDGFLYDNVGFVSLEALESLHEPAAWNQLLVTVARDSSNAAHISAVSDDIVERLERTGRNVYRTKLSRRDQHPLGYIVTALIGVLGFLGLLLTFLSGALITNTLSALLSQHLRQIGVIKLIGGRSDQIVGMYVIMLLGYSLMALAISVPVAAWAAYALSGFVADLINFVLRDAKPFPITPAVVLLQTVITTAIPLLAGLLPVLRSARVPVQQALTDADMAQRAASEGGIDGLLRRLRSRSRPLLISIRNTFRRKKRLLLTLVTLTLGGSIFIAVFNTQVSTDHKVNEITAYFSADVNLDMARLYRVHEIESVARQEPGVERVEAWASARAEVLDAAGDVMDNLHLLAPPIDTQVVPIVIKGRWLVPEDERALAVSSTFAGQWPELGVGDRVRLRIADREEDWTIVGVFRYSGSGDAIAYTSYEHLARWLRHPGRSAMYRIIATHHDLAYQRELAARLDALLTGLSYKVHQAEAGDAFAASVTDILRVLTVVLVVMALLAALVGSIGLAGTLSMNVLERTREIGVMRAIGAHDRLVLNLVMTEGLLIGLMSYVLGALLSFPITHLLSNVINQAIFDSPAAFSLTWYGFAIWFAVVLALTAGASALPARNATHLTIREVLAYE